MHYRFLVTFNAEDAENSEEARSNVSSRLDEEGFTSQGRWGGGFADWFVIGGRWSGELSRHTWAREITKQFSHMEQEHGVQVWGAFYPGNSDKERMQQELATKFRILWDTHAPEEYKGIPYQRDTYLDTGYADDAMLLTQELYDALLKEYTGEESEYHTDLDYDPVSPEMVGKKWLVVVDYHN